MSTFQLSLNQIISMFAFILIGCILKVKKTVPDNASKVISSVLVNVCMPALIFLNCATNMTFDKLIPQSKNVLCGIIVLIISYFVAVLLSKLFSNDDFERRVYTYSFTIPNIGYMGSPLIEAVFGSEALFHALMFIFPMYVFIYSKGVSMLTPNPQKGIGSVVKQPSIIAMLAGILIGLCGIRLPIAVEKIASSASACVGPCAMILTGCVLAEKNFIGLLKDAKAYIASVIRLLIIPCLFIAAMLLFKVDNNIIITAGAMLAMPLGLNTVVFPEAYDGDGSKGAGLALISHTLSVITIPLIFTFLGSLS